MWNKLKLHKKSKIYSTLKKFDFEKHFNLVTKEETPLNPDQLKVKTKVHESSPSLSRKSHIPSKFTNYADITNEDVFNFIKKLKKGTSPGIDGVTAEHYLCSIP